MTPYMVILVGFAALLATGLAMDLLGRAGREPFRPLARVLEAAMGSSASRWLVLAIWLWIGFHFLAR